MPGTAAPGTLTHPHSPSCFNELVTLSSRTSWPPPLPRPRSPRAQAPSRAAPGPTAPTAGGSGEIRASPLTSSLHQGLVSSDRSRWTENDIARSLRIHVPKPPALALPPWVHLSGRLCDPRVSLWGPPWCLMHTPSPRQSRLPPDLLPPRDCASKLLTILHHGRVSANLGSTCLGRAHATAT